MVDTDRRRRRPAYALTIVMALAVLAGAAIMVLDGFIGLGAGWRWYHGALGLVVGGLCVETVRSYVTGTKRVAA